MPIRYHARMTSVCLYFQIHQPYRLRRYSVFEKHPFYFDNLTNRGICQRVADNCYRPATRLLRTLAKDHQGEFRFAISITGCALQQLQEWAPDVVEQLQYLVERNACEILGETYFHSLASVFSREEFNEQVALHEKQIKDVFDVSPQSFRNTELIYNNALAGQLAGAGRYKTVLCEGVDRLLHGRSPNQPYAPPGGKNPAAARVKLLLRNHRLSDDIAFRFADPSWSHHPLKAHTFASWIDKLNDTTLPAEAGTDESYPGARKTRVSSPQPLCNLFMDYETIGEHLSADTGIFDFFRDLPKAIIESGGGRNDFVTPSDAAMRYQANDTYDVPEPSSWADAERDLSAWHGNAMQTNATEELYELEEAVKDRHAAGDEHILDDWRKLTTSDHVYYMATKHWSDGAVHKYFSPYDSPYDAYINFMNVLDDIRQRAEGK